MDDKPEQRLARQAKMTAIQQLDTSGTKKRSALTHEHSGREKKARKTMLPPPSARVDKDAEDVGTQFHKTPSSNRKASDSGMIGSETILALDMENQIAAEARGVSRKNVPWDQFCSIYLCDFNVQAQPKLVKSVKKIGEGDWDEELVWNRMRLALSDKVLCDLKLFHAGTKTLPDAEKGKEVPSKPDFVLHVGGESPTWTDVEFLFEHTRSLKETVTMKFTQWLRNAWSVFRHQPFRLHLYGIIFRNPCAYVCYADHGCTVYSEPLYFGEKNQHARFLADFLTWFIANPGHRGRDSTVDPITEERDMIHIRHAGDTWTEQPKDPLCYRPCLIGRNIRVALVEKLNDNVSKENKVIMKSSWEEKLSLGSSPPSEVEVLTILQANVGGLPQPYFLESAVVKGDGNLEVETRSFPENCEVALPASTTKLMTKLLTSLNGNEVSKPLPPGANVGDPLLPRRKFQTQTKQFNQPLEVRRRLTRILMSYCVPLKEAMSTRGPEALIEIIRDAMIVYYEAYKSGFIHGDISIENILVTQQGCELTGGLTYKDRRGTIIDWNLCFNDKGETSNRVFRSGTPAFMAPVLLNDGKIFRRTLGHDMESFFAVIVWMATLDHANEAAFRAKPLASMMLDRAKTRKDIAVAKESWFVIFEKFHQMIVAYFEPAYRKDEEFLRCLIELRHILYPKHEPSKDLQLKQLMGGGRDKNDNKETEEDPMKEGLFRKCMEAMDGYFGNKKGCNEMRRIDSEALTRPTPESLIQEGNQVD